MASTNAIVGGSIGAVAVVVLFAIVFIAPPEWMRADISDDDDESYSIEFDIKLNTTRDEINVLEGEISVLEGEISMLEGEIVKLSEEIDELNRIQAAADKEEEGKLSLVEIFEMTEPGVVSVSVQRDNTTNATSNDGGRSLGSGFVFDIEGHIITNEHVITNATEIVVTFLDGREYNAEIVGEDVDTDIAIIKVESELASLHPLAIGNSSELKVGEAITAIGNPFGLSGSMTSGIISQLGRLLPADSGFSIPGIIQTDAAINPGNSGGPLLNVYGEVVGINTAIQSSTGEFTGVGFAIPSKTVSKIVPILIDDGEYRHPWIGISGRDVDLELAETLNLREAVGFLIITVIDDSPADIAGLMGSNQTAGGTDDGMDAIGGDVIMSVDGIEVRDIDDILIHLQNTKEVGDEMVLEILRDGEILEVTIVLQARPG